MTRRVNHAPMFRLSIPNVAQKPAAKTPALRYPESNVSGGILTMTHLKGFHTDLESVVTHGPGGFIGTLDCVLE